jgi:hypothetical protein
MRLVLLLIVAACGSVHAQTQKGSFMVGGSGNVQYTRAPSFGGNPPSIITVPRTSATVSPNVGYFIIDGLVAGASLSVSGSKSKQPGLSWSQMEVEAGPFVRYYYSLGEKISVFPAVSATWGNTKTNKKINDGFGVQDNVAVEGIATYYHFDAGDSNPTKAVRFNVGLQFFIPSKGAGTQSNE